MKPESGFDEASIAALLELTLEGVVLHDTAGVIVACNPAAERILGIPRRDLQGRSSLFLNERASDAAGYPLLPEEEPVWQVLRTGRPASARPVRLKNDATGETWVELNSAPVWRGDGDRASGAVTCIVDACARRASEHEARDRHRMELIGRLAGGVAHDFNNLLTVILGYNGMLLDSLDPADERWREADEVRKAAQRGADLTRHLLAMSRGQIVEARVLDVNHAIADMLPMLRQIAGASVRVQLSVPHEVLAVRADQGQLEQLVMNLVLNARDAMPGGGVVQIRTSVADLDAPFVSAHPGSRAGRFALLEVTDTGTGMDEATRRRIFEPFFTTKPHEKGTGLGLATVFGIVKQHGGYIDVESSPGAGASFRLYLPLRSELPQPTRSPDRPAPPRRASGTVLLVVGDEQVRRLARRVLQRSGYEVLDESDGERALALANQRAGAVTALVADLVLPGLGGVDLARRVLARQPDVRVLFFSGYTDGSFEPTSLPILGARLLAKPFRPEALLDQLRYAIASDDPPRCATPSD